jgi:vacuolar-type H+-ATPase subunit E/Vma4
MPLYDQVELLCQAITHQAQSEVEKIQTQAREEADRRVAEAEAHRREMLAKTRAEVEAQARLDARNRIDRAELEGKRHISQTKETGLGEIFTQAQARLQALRATAEYRDWLRRALVGALTQLEGKEFRVAANPEEAEWLTPELLAAVGAERSCQLDFSADPDLPPGGFVVIRADGRVRVDETFQAILARRRETLRAEIAGTLWGG